MEFRAFLIKLFNQLSDTDRQALHFSIGNQIPRKYRDNCTPSGSLLLLDSLFDQNLISEQNFNYLINIFEQINCYNASTQLKEYKIYTIQIEPISPRLNELSFNFENDKIYGSFSRKCFTDDVQRQLSQISPISPGNSIELERPIIPSSTITSSEDTDTFDENEKKQWSSTIQKIVHTKRALFCIILVIINIVSIILCLILLCVFLIRPAKINHSTSSLVIKQELFYIIKEGLQYGNTNLPQNESFNDAKDLQLSYTDRCTGVELRWTNISLISIRIFYSNNRSSNIFTSQINNLSFVSSQFTNTFMLTSNEEINQINLYQNFREINFSISGIQFRTTNGRKSDVFGSNNGHFLTESFEYYTFAYAKGKEQSNKGIEMLQFVWIKQISAKEQIITEPRSMLEVCGFTFTSSQDSQFIYVKGVQSSWYDLKQKFNRQGTECNSTASYYEKISPLGPQLFAIINKTSVFYHHDDKWYQYRSAGNIRCNLIPRSGPNSFEDP